MAKHNFVMCHSCKEQWDKKGGLGQLCASCVHNRDAIDSLESQVRALELTPIDRAMKLRDELFDVANSYAGDETGHVAGILHEACNNILRAKVALAKQPAPAEG